jgi:hypothetical protein
MAKKTFSIGSGVTVTLTDVTGGVQIDVVGAGKDITAIFFDLANDNNLTGYTTAAAILPIGTNTTPLINEVTASQFSTNSISSIGGVNLNPAGGFDAGIEITDNGSCFSSAATIVESLWAYSPWLATSTRGRMCVPKGKFRNAPSDCSGDRNLSAPPTFTFQKKA